MSQYPTYSKKKLQKNLDENFPKNENFKKFATPLHLEILFKYLFDFDLLKDLEKNKPDPKYPNWKVLQKDKWVCSKTLNKDKLEEILKLRCVNRKMNKFVSRNCLWKKFLEKTCANNLLAFRNLETPNDNHYLEIFKLKSFELKKDLKVFIDIGTDFIRLAFNLPVIKKEYNFYQEYLASNAYNGKVENLINNYCRDLWGRHVGINLTIEKLNNYDNKEWDSRSTYQNGIINYVRIVDVLSYFSCVYSSIDFSFSLPFFLFSDFEYREEKYVELIKYDEEKTKDYKEVLIEKDPNSRECRYYMNLPEGYLSSAIKANTQLFEEEMKDENDLRKI